MVSVMPARGMHPACVTMHVAWLIDTSFSYSPSPGPWLCLLVAAEPLRLRPDAPRRTQPSWSPAYTLSLACTKALQTAAANGQSLLGSQDLTHLMLDMLERFTLSQLLLQGRPPWDPEVESSLLSFLRVQAHPALSRSLTRSY